tara:strand:- start:6678 stop:7148 length:471 start_codon:yes stop_codon:yes gene_type:complete
MVSVNELFQIIEKDLEETPPIFNNLNKLLEQFVEGLCKFCPSKTNIHTEIKNTFPKEIKFEDTLFIITKLVYWIEKFQCPNDDKFTQNILNNVKNNINKETIIIFLRQYYDHTERVWKETWEARERLLNGENIVPPKHRKKVSGKNGIPFNMKSGL